MKTFFRRRPVWAICSLALASVCATAALPVGNAERGPVRTAPAIEPVATEARVIVKYRADSALMRALSATAAQSTGPQHAASLATRLGLTLADGRAIGERTQVVRGSGLTSTELAAQLSAQSDVEYAEVDARKYALAVTINDPLYLNAAATQTPASGQWYLQTPTSTLVSAINAPGAWAITTGKSSLVVADLDTGIRADHPDLTNKLVAGRNFVSTNGTSQNGWSADPSDPGDYTTTTNQCNDGAAPQNSSWHGTQTAGIIGAQTNNGYGMASIGRDVMIQPLRVLGTCGGYDSDIQAAMLYAAGINVPGAGTNPTPARVINMSLGSKGACSAGYQDAVNQLAALPQPVVVVVASGNDGLALGTPANCTGVVSVVGVRHIGTKVGYSDLGPNATISAPAGNCVNSTGACLYPILTTSNSGLTTPVAGSGGAIYTDGLNDLSLGTSFATPLVTGTVALMLSANPALTTAQVISALTGTARSFPTAGAGAGVPICAATSATAQNYECYCTTSACGAGLLDASAAVARAASGVPVANIDTLTTVLVGNSLPLSGMSSKASATTSAIQTYAWSVSSGASLARFTGATNASTATLLGTAPGTVVVSLTVTDNMAGKAATSSTTLTVVTPTVAAITPSATSVTAGSSIGLDGTASHTLIGSVVGYQWTITAGSLLATFSGAVNTPTVALLTSASGTVTVSLTVTDVFGKSATTSQSLTVTPAPSSSGGGAIGVSWLLGWLASLIGVWAVTPRARRR